MRYFCSPNQKTVLRTRRIVELRSGPKDAKVAKKVPYLECGAVGKKSRFHYCPVKAGKSVFEIVET